MKNHNLKIEIWVLYGVLQKDRDTYIQKKSELLLVEYIYKPRMLKGDKQGGILTKGQGQTGF